MITFFIEFFYSTEISAETPQLWRCHEKSYKTRNNKEKYNIRVLKHFSSPQWLTNCSIDSSELYTSICSDIGKGSLLYVSGGSSVDVSAFVVVACNNIVEFIRGGFVGDIFVVITALATDVIE